MDNNSKLVKLFASALNLDESIVNDDLVYQGVKEWDSVGHMMLVARIDEEFDTMLDTEDVINMSSFKKAKEILGKYDIEF
jgi:acyl carrier protein